MLTGVVCSDTISAAQPSDEEWPDDDPVERSLEVNEGVLTFIPPVTGSDVLSTEIRLDISKSSLVDGWVKLSQCYRNLHPVSATDIVYRYRQIRDLRLVNSSNIGSVTIEGQILQLVDVTRGAELCLSAEIDILEHLRSEEGQRRHYRISNGPYHLRFLDGYYPFHLSFNMTYPVDQLEIADISPQSQPLFMHKGVAGKLSIETWFEGELTIDIELKGRQPE